MVDPHTTNLKLQQCMLPPEFDIFQGYNIPKSHQHVPKNLSADELTVSSQRLFNILEQSWIQSSAWKSVYEAVKMFASSLTKYSAYLSSQSVGESQADSSGEEIE
ncbi:uncharacterized protein LOC124291542 isoform X2 [Haliotis rubra]|uniref:uncharacterized protein LOC124291542 isoform X2 n=1 Tax=Haliotis rubra TaxID=36100 RepID=UPI001EE53A6E|nr:uncharacterized protein LOC124291542 isoform X2 [Haliotis rubra]